METYERLICDLGRRLLTKGLNNDFSESGRDPGKDVTRTGEGAGVEGGGHTKSSPRTRRAALTVMSPDRHFNEKKTFVCGGGEKKSTSALSSETFSG